MSQASQERGHRGYEGQLQPRQHQRVLAPAQALYNHNHTVKIPFCVTPAPSGIDSHTEKAFVSTCKWGAVSSS